MTTANKKDNKQSKEETNRKDLTTNIEARNSPKNNNIQEAMAKSINPFFKSILNNAYFLALLAVLCETESLKPKLEFKILK